MPQCLSLAKFLKRSQPSTGRLGASCRPSLSDPLMAVTVDPVIEENDAPFITQVSDNTAPDDRTQYMTWARQYLKVRSSFQYRLSRRMSTDVTAFLYAGSL
jgi:hypothetical protein